jgi:hypothetical protein
MSPPCPYKLLRVSIAKEVQFKSNSYIRRGDVTSSVLPCQCVCSSEHVAFEMTAFALFWMMVDARSAIMYTEP